MLSKEEMSNPMMKIIGLGAIISFILAAIIAFIIIFFLGFNLFGLGLGIMAFVIVMGIIFSIMMFLTGIIAFIYYILRDTGKKFQRTTSNNYKSLQQEEVGKKSQSLTKNKKK